jgi:predicted ATPase
LLPTALLFSRYRAFRELARVNLAPLNIVIGKNGSGKSVLTRLPVLLASGFSLDSEAPLDLMAGGICHATRYEDLIFQRSAQPFTLGAEISNGHETLRFITTLRHVVETHSLGVEGFELYRGNERVVALSIVRPEDIGKPEGAFVAKIGNVPAEEPVQVELRGLFPSRVRQYGNLQAELDQARSQFKSAFFAPCYLGPFRSEQGALTQIPRQGVHELGPRGERALDIIGDDRLRRDGALVDAVEDWFQESMNARLKLVMSGELPRVVVNDPLRNLDVDVGETGAGFAQLFPVVVQALGRKTDRLQSPIVVVEQPELHLHPAAHGVVADLICSTVLACEQRVRYLCETHSEQIVVRVRRRIAERKILPNMVKIISVGHQSTDEEPPEDFREIAVDDMGTPDAWPSGVFDEAFNDLVQLREAAQQRPAAGANEGR